MDSWLPSDPLSMMGSLALYPSPVLGQVGLLRSALDLTSVLQSPSASSSLAAGTGSFSVARTFYRGYLTGGNC